MDKKYTKEEFFKMMLSFREKLGNKNLSGKQCRQLHKMLTIAYLNVKVPRDEIAGIAFHYQTAIDEYIVRMGYLGYLGHSLDEDYNE